MSLWNSEETGPGWREWVIDLVSVSFAVTEHGDQNSSARKGFIWLTLAHCCSAPKEVRIGTRAGQEPGGRS